ncbi:Ig-like domain-containing protein, partial [Candidatus Pacearchaeota archaeon]|nr:Ig-like domain-containing protein [Candidatus Pacearchaeota archaeon]
ATVSSNTFSAKGISLNLGENQIRVIARDRMWNESEASISIIYDNTPPTTPATVTDDGEYTAYAAQLHAVWAKSEDSESGISRHLYSIGTTPGGTDVVNWTSTGINTEVTHTGLSLIQGQSYYFNVKAINGAGISSGIKSSDGILVNGHIPTITDITPADGSKFQTGETINIKITAADEDNDTLEYQFKIDSTIKQSFSNSSSYSWTMTEDDTGTHIVTCEVRDNYGGLTSNNVTYEVILDNIPPVVDITYPADGAVFIITPITVTGTIDDNYAAVIVNNKTATVSSGQFSVDNIDLALGNNTITATATDLAGNTATDSITVIYDNTKPATPTITDDGEYTSSLTELHASWSSEDTETNIAEYQYSIGTCIGSTDVVNWTSTGTDTEVTYTGLTLIQGQSYFFNVKAINAVGIWSDVGSSDGIIAEVLSLSIEITYPENNASLNTSPITVEGTVTIDSANITVNGVSAAVTNNTFSVSLNATEGINIITARAATSDQTASDQIEVNLDLTPPNIYIFTPDENVTTKSNVIHGRISEDAVSLTINETPAELIDGYFIAQPSLAEGVNTVTLEAIDQAGNTSQVTHTFIFNSATPKVTITSPANNSTIDLSPITVTGITTTDITYILVESSVAIIEDTNFTANHIKLSPVKSVITAIGYDENDNKYQDTIIINTPNLRSYDLVKDSGDIQGYEDYMPEVGSNWNLTAKLYCNDVPVSDEEIEFTITKGNGTLSYQYVQTDIDGLATVTLMTDTDACITNEVEAKSSTHPELKVIFYVDTKASQPANLIKITDETQTQVPEATIPLIVKLTDAYGNVVRGEQIDFSVSQGTGTLSANSAITDYYGHSRVNLTAPATPETLTQVIVTSASIPSVTVTFDITTSETPTVTVDDIIAKVNANDKKIQDSKADVLITSNDPFMPSEMHLKIWQKGNKQKVEEISPDPQVKIVPPLEDSTEDVEREIIFCDLANNIYAIKTKAQGQIEECPYHIDYVDYEKGVVIKTEYYSKIGDKMYLYMIEDSDFIKIDNIWVFQKEKETLYRNLTELEHTTVSTYSNIEINTGIPDSEFE